MKNSVKNTATKGSKAAKSTVKASKAAKSASKSQTVVSKAGKLQAKKQASKAPTAPLPKNHASMPATPSKTWVLFQIGLRVNREGLSKKPIKTDYRADGLTNKQADALIKRLNTKYAYKPAK
jgi:hypothetical protein